MNKKRNTSTKLQIVFQKVKNNVHFLKTSTFCYNHCSFYRKRKPFFNIQLPDKHSITWKLHRYLSFVFFSKQPENVLKDRAI